MVLNCPATNYCVSLHTFRLPSHLRSQTVLHIPTQILLGIHHSFRYDSLSCFQASDQACTASISIANIHNVNNAFTPLFGSDFFVGGVYADDHRHHSWLHLTCTQRLKIPVATNKILFSLNKVKSSLSLMNIIYSRRFDFSIISFFSHPRSWFQISNSNWIFKRVLLPVEAS